MVSGCIRSRAVAAAVLLAWALGALTLGGCAPKRVLRQPDWQADRPPATEAPVRKSLSRTAPVAQAPPDAPAADLPPELRASASGDLSRPIAPLGLAVANQALEQIGRPYRWGGEQPHRGFDCSGLVRWSYARVGVELPRAVIDQRRVGQSIDPSHLQPGDLVFFKTRGDRTTHVGIYIGDGAFVHAPRAGQPVRTDSLDDPWWRGRWTDARRVVID